MRCIEWSRRAAWAVLLVIPNASAMAGCEVRDLDTAQADGSPEDGTGDLPDQAAQEAGSGMLSAAAGDDQTVAGGQTVVLSGQGSDSGGATLTFSWGQVAGPPVALGAPSAAQTTFVAPKWSATLEFMLTVRSDSGQASDSVTVQVRGESFLFVANRGNNSVARYRIAPSLDGDAAPEAAWRGPNTRLQAPSGIAVDNVGGLLVSNADNNRITGFADAFGAAGDIVPERYVGGAASPLDQPEGLAYHAVGDLLFVPNFDAFPGTVNVWANVSSLEFFGEVQPAATLRSPEVQNARDIEVGPAGELYVVGSGAQSIVVINDTGGAGGDVPAARTITSNAFENKVLTDAFLDDTDHLFVAAANINEIAVFDGASQLDGSVSPARVIRLDGAAGVAGIAVDSAGTGYASDDVLNAIYIFEGAASRQDTVVPERTIAGPGTWLSKPAHLLIVDD